MNGPGADEIRRVIREVLAEESRQASRPVSQPTAGGPAVLIVYHGGTARLAEAQEQARRIAETSRKSGVYTSEAVRADVCGLGPDGRPRGQCSLDTVDRSGLEKVLEKAALLVLPTFCLSVAAKVSRLEFGDPDAGLVLSALVQGKPVLASNDGFLVLGRLKNDGLKKEFGRILSVLADWGVTFAPTEKLADEFFRLIGTKNTSGSGPAAPPVVGGPEGLKLVTANDVRRALSEKRSEIVMAPGGLATPLARDLARDYSITIKMRKA
jgi:hypothetical protein